MNGKLDKAVVLYMPPAVLNPEGKHEGSRCGRCMMFLPDKKACTIVYRDGTKDTGVSVERGVCGLYVGGMQMKSSPNHKPMPTVPRSVAGYIEQDDVPTHCANCRNNLGGGICAKVDGSIEDNACCNAWESKAQAGNTEYQSKGAAGIAAPMRRNQSPKE